MDLGIKGKWALVGGASKGLGYGCAHSLAREGVNVVIVARGADALNAAAVELRKLGTTVLPVAVDITTPEGREAIWSVAGGPGKNIDIVVTNAGGPPELVTTMSKFLPGPPATDQMAARPASVVM